MSDYLKQQWAKFTTWITAHGGPTKVVAAAIIILGLAYGAVPEFHDFCVKIWSTFPTGLKTFLVTASTLYAWLRNPATRKIVDGILGPGDKATVNNPVLSPDGTLTGTSATVVKASEGTETAPAEEPAPAAPVVKASNLTSPLIIPK